VSAAAASDNRLRGPLHEAFASVPFDWRGVTQPFAEGPTGRSLAQFVDERLRDGAIVYPASVFRALELTAPRDVRVVILGQDPYHGAGQAQGLAFCTARWFAALLCGAARFDEPRVMLVLCFFAGIPGREGAGLRLRVAMARCAPWHLH
jgi:hypothetical protein